MKIFLLNEYKQAYQNKRWCVQGNGDKPSPTCLFVTPVTSGTINFFGSSWRFEPFSAILLFVFKVLFHCWCAHKKCEDYNRFTECFKMTKVYVIKPYNVAITQSGLSLHKTLNQILTITQRLLNYFCITS